jgi:hypothetical protein
MHVKTYLARFFIASMATASVMIVGFKVSTIPAIVGGFGTIALIEGANIVITGRKD